MEKKIKPLARSPLGRGLSSLISTPPVSVFPNLPPIRAAAVTSNVAINQSAPDVSASDIPSANAPTGPTANTDAPVVQFVDIALIRNNPKQPRQLFSEPEIVELADSIRQLGVLQPVLVRPVLEPGSKESYELIAGERRWRAAQRVELKQLPVIIKHFSDREALEIGLVENIQRENLNPIEQAAGYRRLMEEFGLSQNDVADRVGKDRTSVANFVRLLKLAPDVQELLSKGQLSTGHAKAILSIKDESAQSRLARKAVEEGLSVRSLEAIVARAFVLDSGRRPASRNSATVDGRALTFPEVIDRLRQKLGTKVLLHHTRSGAGKLEIEYFSEQELERVVDLICR